MIGLIFSIQLGDVRKAINYTIEALQLSKLELLLFYRIPIISSPRLKGRQNKVFCGAIFQNLPLDAPWDTGKR